MVSSGKKAKIASSSREAAYETQLGILKSAYEMQRVALDQRHQKKIDDLKKNYGIE